MAQNSENSVTSLVGAVKRLCSLYFDNMCLTAAEKATIFMSTAAIALLIMMLGLVALLFIVVGIATLLESYIEPFWSYFIVAGIFLVIIGVIIIFRVQLVFNPMARFMSKLFVNPPKDK